MMSRKQPPSHPWNSLGKAIIEQRAQRQPKFIETETHVSDAYNAIPSLLIGQIYSHRTMENI